MKRCHKWNMSILLLLFLFSFFIMMQSFVIGTITLIIVALATYAECEAQERFEAKEEAERIAKEKEEAEFEARRQKLKAISDDMNERFAKQQKEITEVYKTYAQLCREVHEIKYGKGED